MHRMRGICIALFLILMNNSCSSDETSSLIECARKLRSGMKSDEVKLLFPSSFFLEEKLNESSGTEMTCQYSTSEIYKRLSWLEHTRGFLTVDVYFDEKDKIIGYIFQSSSEPWLFKKEDCTGVYLGPAR